MKLKEFRTAIANHIDNVVDGKQLIMMLFHNQKIYLKAKYPNGTTSKLSEGIIDYVYLNDEKKRLFYVGKSIETKSWLSKLLSKNGYMALKIKDFYTWAKAERDKYDDYEVFFAWYYEHKDDDVYVYIPLSDKIDLEPTANNFNFVVFHSVEDINAFKFKSKNLKESIINLERKRAHGKQ